MQYDVIYTRLATTLADSKDLELNEITPHEPLSTLALDSLDYVELMVLAMREFHVTIEAELFTNHPQITLEELCQHIFQKSVEARATIH